MNAQQIDAALYRAATCQQSGQIKQAVDLYLSVLKIEPRNAVANHNLGIVAMQTGKGLEIAVPLFKTAWQADPAHNQHWMSLVRALVQTGAIKAAREVYADGNRRGLRGPDVDLLLARLPGQVDAANTPAVIAIEPAELAKQRNLLQRLLADRQFAQLQIQARALISRQPTLAWAWHCLATALRALQKPREALEALEHVARLEPNGIEALLELAQLATTLELHAEAHTAFARALLIEPAHPAAQRGLVNGLLREFRHAEAIAACQLALRTAPDAFDLLRLLGDAQLGLQQFDAALASYQRAWDLLRGDVDSYQKLGSVLHARSDELAMITLAEQMLQANPQYVDAQADLGRVLLAAGRLEEATAAFGQALHSRPDDLVIRESWLFCCNYLPKMSPDALLAQARIYGAALARRAKPYQQWHCAPAPQRLRVGLVSGDLREHPVAYFLESVLERSDPEQIEWFVYATNSASDATSARLQQLVQKWESLVGLETAAAAQLIHTDGVHVLVDLSGYTALNRMPVFTWRPAPIQVSWLGYFATTGLAEMDYLLADRISVPEEHRRHFSESVWYLPDSRLCFTPPDAAPDVAPLPAMERGYLTFGCFQALRKITDQVLAAWSKVLSACPGARLRIQNGELRNDMTRANFEQRLANHGIDLVRVDLHERQARAQYLLSHAEVDVLLDTFPFPGGTTTCEALWMGVPTITLCGASMIGRQGASLLSAAGMQTWVAESVADYVAIAQRASNNVSELKQLRDSMRAQVSASALLDASRFANNLQQALRQMWEQRQRG